MLCAMNSTFARLCRAYAAGLLINGAAVAAEQQETTAGVFFPEGSGAALYVEFCAVCHGSEARGGGPLAATLSVAAPDLRRMSVLAGGQFPAERVRRHIDGRDINPAHGSREMPIWGSVFKRTRGAYGERRVEERLDNLVEYLRRIQDAE